MKNIQNQTYIIAEAAQGYEGSVDIAKLLIKAAHAAKADAVKFQVVYADGVCEKNYEHYDLYKQLELTQEEWQEVRDFAKQYELDFIVDVSSNISFNIIKNINVDGVKLHSTNFFNNELIENMLSLDKKFYLSVGGIKNNEIIDFIARYKLTSANTVILFGFQAEPTPIESNNLLRIDSLKELTGLEIGFMDHSEAGGLYDTSLSVLALGMGVNIFEKHITLDRELKIEDYISALTPGEFYRYTQTIKNLPQALGSGNLELNENELIYRHKVLKKVVATKNLYKGDIITLADIKLSRPEKPGGHYKLSDIINKKVKKNILTGNFIRIEDVS